MGSAFLWTLRKSVLLSFVLSSADREITLIF